MMTNNDFFKELFDVVPFSSYIVDIDTYEVIYVNKLMKYNLFDSKRIKCWEKIYGQENKCSWCSIDKLTNFIYQKEERSYKAEFFNEIEDKWFISHDKLISLPTFNNAKYSILVDITEQKEIQGNIIQSHAKLAMYVKHLAITNKNLQITKLLLQKKSDEFEDMNNSLEIIVDTQLEKIRTQDQLLFFHQEQISLDNIMSIIAHQWKQPLHELSINNIYLNEKNKKKEYKKIYYDNNEIIQFLSSTITAFRDFYTLSNADNFSIIESIECTMQILNSSARLYNININFYSNNIEMRLCGQRNVFSQVLLNILENAISIIIERNINNAFINIMLNQINSEIILTIEDNAGGINEKDLPFIFDNSKSFRKKPSSGIGLYISNLVIIEKFKGRLFAENTEKGAIFTIIIPININNS